MLIAILQVVQALVVIMAALPVQPSFILSAILVFSFHVLFRFLVWLGIGSSKLS